MRRETVLPVKVAHESRKLYCLLLDTLASQAGELLPWAVEGYFWHVWRAQFPETPTAVKPRTTQAEVLRERLARALRKQHQEVVDIKESFRENEDAVAFAILVKQPSLGRWEELLQLERPRLKTARLAAYDAALELTASPLPSK